MFTRGFSIFFLVACFCFPDLQSGRIRVKRTLEEDIEKGKGFRSSLKKKFFKAPSQISTDKITVKEFHKIP